ncbi:hypothetical protein H4S01_004926, partial [Coemansia sp. RSA 2610]
WRRTCGTCVRSARMWASGTQWGCRCTGRRHATTLRRRRSSMARGCASTRRREAQCLGSCSRRYPSDC